MNEGSPFVLSCGVGAANLYLFLTKNTGKKIQAVCSLYFFCGWIGERLLNLCTLRIVEFAVTLDEELTIYDTLRGLGVHSRIVQSRRNEVRVCLFGSFQHIQCIWSYPNHRSPLNDFAPVNLLPILPAG